MADTIKGLTVKIGADTSDFIKELKKVDKEINATQRTANELQKGLQLEFDSNRFTQAQKKVQSALDTTEAKAKAIREQLKYLEDTGGVDTAGYQKLETELAKTETRALQLREQLEQIDKLKFENATKNITKLSNGLETAAKKTALVSAASVGAITGVWKLGSDAATTGANLQDMADRLDISAEALQRYDYIALQSGVETEQLVKSIAKARDAVGTALAGGTNTASKTLQTLFGDLSKIPTGTEEAFTAIIEKLSQVEDSTMQAYYANEIFGERLATNLIPLINNGADRLAQLGEEFESIGYLSNEQVQALADFDDELNIMKERLELAKTELGIALLPIMERFADLLSNKVVPAIKQVAEWFSGLSESSQNLVVTSLLLTAGLSPVLMILSKIVGIIPTIIKGLNTLSTHPIIAIIGVVTGLLLYLYTTNEQFAQSVNKLISVLGRGLSAVFEPIVDILSTALQLLSPIIDLLVNLLVPALELVAKFLEPIVWLLEKISDFVNGIGDFILKIFGKGWLWGKEDTSATSTTSPTPSINDYNFNIPATSSSSLLNNYSNDTYNLGITMNTTGDLNYDAEELANAVIKKIVVAKQSSGR